MSDGRKTKFKEPMQRVDLPKMKLEVVSEAVTLGYPMLTGQSIPDHGARHAGSTYTEPQRHPIDRELVNPQADVGGRRFGDWVLLMPTKMSGGTYAVNLNTGRALAWISYWNYGDYSP